MPHATGADGGTGSGAGSVGEVVVGAMGAGPTGLGGDQNNWLQMDGREMFTVWGSGSAQPEKASPNASTSDVDFANFMGER